MSDQAGEQLTELNCGDHVVVTVEGSQYDGEVIETKRWMCELNQGFMESGDILVRIELSTETVSQHELPGEYISISATENAPRAWDVPQASVYKPIEDETTIDLGAVTEVTTGNNPQ